MIATAQCQWRLGGSDGINIQVLALLTTGLLSCTVWTPSESRTWTAAVSVPFKITTIDHVVLCTADPERLEAFYTGVLGCELVRRQERTGLTQLRAGTALIDIVPAEYGHAGDGSGAVRIANMEHFCLRIDPFDPDAIRRHLDQHGISYGEIADRFGAEGRGPSIYVQDPEGNRVELKGPAHDQH